MPKVGVFVFAWTFFKAGNPLNGLRPPQMRLMVSRSFR